MNGIDLSFIDAIKKKKPKARYVKPQSVKQLEKLHFEAKKLRYMNNPAILRTKFRDDGSNELTKTIIAWLKLNGHFGARVNTTGTYSAKLGKYIHSGARKGMADIQAIINGKHVSIEVKTNKDRIRPDQMKVKSEVEAAGGKYFVVRNFDDFLNQIKEI